jgi:two-component system sensor histidine kinase ChvG
VNLFRLSIRAKVLMASAVLLAIPYVGYRYVQEMENFLREGLEASVLGAAQALAGALHDRVDLLEQYASASDDAAFEIFVQPLAYPMQVDGYAEDWEDYRNNLKPISGAGENSGFSARYLAGHHGDYLYLLVEVNDSQLSYRRPGSPRPQPGDSLDLRLGDDPGETQRYRLSPIAPGRVSVYAVARRNPSTPLSRREPRIWAHWQSAPGGYTVELRIPMSLLRQRLAIDVIDVDPVRGKASGILSTAAGSSAKPGRLIFPSPGIEGVIRSLGRNPGRRIHVVDTRGRVLASGGSLARQTPVTKINPLFALLLRPPPADLFEQFSVSGELAGPELDAALDGIEATGWKSTENPDVFIVSAAYPVWIGDQVAGAVLVEETSLGIQTVRRQALAELFSTTLIVFCGAGLLLFLFANRISRRLRKLRDEAEGAIDEHGRVVGEVTGSSGGDEIGDLGRSFSSLMERLRQYNHYLEQLARRLSHELRTPLAVIRSSLDTLAMGDDRSGKYLDRAQAGLSRLDTVIVRMSEATRLEEAMQSAERERFDLDRLLAASVDGYRQAWPDTAMVYAGPGESCMLDGVPDLIAQMLDKLVSNARDFASPGSVISVRLNKTRSKAILLVVNDGPLLPAEMEGKLFESLVSFRSSERSAEPHLGLGLYIVRLIAEYHGAEARAENRPGGEGVTVRVAFPLKAPHR